MECIRPPNPLNSGRFDSIDAFRGLAALAVVFSHSWSGLCAAHFASADTVNDSAGALLSYLFRGSSAYFMIITGFILAAKLPVWKTHPHGLLMRAVQRITKIVLIYWIALASIIVINQLKSSFGGIGWYKTDLLSVLAQFLFFSNYLSEPQLYLAASWYLEADFIIFITLIACYYLWSKFPGYLQQRLRPVIFVSTIAVVYFCVYIESVGPFDRGLSAPIRLLTYFLLGFLAWHARDYVSAMFSLICNSMLILVWNDLTGLHKYLFSSNAIVLAFIFYSSHYSKTLAVLACQPLIVKLYKINFGMFLFNLFFIMIGMSIARHFAPHSVSGLIIIWGLSIAGLFVFSYFFTRYVQQPVLTWHDSAWNRLLNQFQQIPAHNVEAEKGDELFSPETVRADMA